MQYRQDTKIAARQPAEEDDVFAVTGAIEAGQGVARHRPPEMRLSRQFREQIEQPVGVGRRLGLAPGFIRIEPNVLNVLGGQVGELKAHACALWPP